MTAWVRRVVKGGRPDDPDRTALRARVRQHAKEFEQLLRESPEDAKAVEGFVAAFRQIVRDRGRQGAS